MLDRIRNFVIIAHIDHGKSTLADRLLEITGTVEARRMRAQYLDQMELERERGITIKMAPVRMVYKPELRSSKFEFRKKIENQNSKLEIPDSEFILNLIDTPGHSDFAYEVSRALQAVQGAVLLVDASKGIQAQTLSNFRQAKKAGLKIIGAVNKIDLNPPHLEKTISALADLLETNQENIFRISAKTGEGVRELLDAVVKEVPPPSFTNATDGERGLKALIFDSLYDDHKGILAYARVFEGSVKAGDKILFLATGAKLKVKEVGYFAPELKTAKELTTGEIGYIATGIKEPALVKIGDTIMATGNWQLAIGERHALPGYREPVSVVFIAFYPDGATKFDDLKRALERLRLADPALTLEPDANEALGRGMKVGFLGQLHFEITSDRLRRDFGLELLTSFPSISYKIKEPLGERYINQTDNWPDKADAIYQPIIKLEILTPGEFLGQVMSFASAFDIKIEKTQNIGDNLLLTGRMPLSELIRDFDDRLKSASQGYASFSYELNGYELADVRKMEILIAGETQAALTRIVSKKDLEREARQTVERLKELLPRVQFAQAIQAQADNRIIARETIPAMKKDVTGYLYGGDRSRKLKLWKKQERGKERLKESGRVNVPIEVFREILKK